MKIKAREQAGLTLVSTSDKTVSYTLRHMTQRTKLWLVSRHSTLRRDEAGEPILNDEGKPSAVVDQFELGWELMRLSLDSIHGLEDEDAKGKPIEWKPDFESEQVMGKPMLLITTDSLDLIPDEILNEIMLIVSNPTTGLSVGDLTGGEKKQVNFTRSSRRKKNSANVPATRKPAQSAQAAKSKSVRKKTKRATKSR